MRVYIANDHGGVELKNKIIEKFEPLGYTFINYGTDTTDIVRYPYYAEQVAKSVQKDIGSRGILICSTGIGMSVVANKFKGIRAALCTDSYMAKMTRQHNDSNILCLGGQLTGGLVTLDMVELWLESEFMGGRHCISLGLIEELEDAVFTQPVTEGSFLTPGQ